MREESNNKDFFRLLHIHYPLIREMCVTTCRFTGRDDVVSFISEFYSHESQGVQAFKLFETMRDCGMLVKNHSLWGIPSYITLFIRKREGRSHYTSQHLVRACMQDINTHIFGLTRKVESVNVASDEIAEEIFALEDIYQQLAGASQNNCHKISQDVSAFQLGNSLEVSTTKINHFLELYDNFIMPMLAIVVDPDNELEGVSIEVLELCDKLLEPYGNTELGYHIRGLKQSVRVIQEQIAGKILQAKNELDALFEVYREHRRIVQGINYFWEITIEERENEKSRIFNKYFLTSTRLRSQNSSTRAYLNYIQRSLYQEKTAKEAPSLLSLSRSDDYEASTFSGMVCFSDICNSVLKEPQLPCLLSWLCKKYSGESATFFIDNLFKLEKCFPDYIKISDKTKSYQLDSVQVELQLREWQNDGK